MEKYKWLNKHSRLFLERGYLEEDLSPEKRIRQIAENAERILGIQGFADKFENYMSLGFFSLATPIWSNFGNKKGLPVSCVSEDSWINTVDGGKQAKDICIGDLVLTHKGRYKKVIDVIPTSNSKNIYLIKIGSRLTPVKITGNHKIKTNLGWVRVDELNVSKHLVAVNGDIETQISDISPVFIMEKYVEPFYELDDSDGLLKHKINIKNQKKTGRKYSNYHSEVRNIIPITNDLSWAIGLWFAEGSLITRKYGKPSGIRITLGADEMHFAKKWFNIICQSFNLKGNISESILECNGKKNSWLNVNINSNIIGNLFESFGKGCKNKKVPSLILNSNLNIKKSFLDGLLTGDGGKNLKLDNIKITLANPYLILQTYKIGLELGLEMSLQMQEKVGVLSSVPHVHTIIFRNYTNSRGRNCTSSGIKFEDGLIYCPIISLIKTNLTENVYDFTVEEDHSFSVSGVVVHNCFGSYILDDTIGIFDKVGEVGIMSKNGGGTSGFFGDLRPRGSKISKGGTTDGPIRFMELFDKTSDVISQGNSRRGSFAAYLPVEHPDIEEFLQIRSSGHPIQNMSIGVTITDNWMKEMINGDKDKRNIWAKIIQKRFETGYPYISFIDNINNNAPKVYKDKNLKIKAQNLCVAGNQRVPSNFGIKTAKELYEIGKDLILFDNQKKVLSSKMELVEKNVDTYTIILENGMSHTVTPYHKINVFEKFSSTNSKYGYKIFTKDVECRDLKVGDKVSIQTNEGVFGSVNKPKEAFLLGLYQGDGTQHKDLIMIDVWENDFDLISEIQDCHNYVCEKYNTQFSKRTNRLYPMAKFHNCYVSHSPVKKKRLTSKALKKSLNFEKGYVPNWIWESDRETQWQYVRGLYYTDGTVGIYSGKGDAIQLSLGSINKSWLKELQILLNNLGMQTSIRLLRKSGKSLLPDGKGGQKFYKTKTSWRLLIGNKTNCIKFNENTGFLTRKGVNIENRKYRDNTKKFYKIKSIKYAGKQDVFCCNVNSDNHHFICNGFITHNCNEIALFSDSENSFVCVLSSLNLFYWDEIFKTDAIETLIYFLDAVNEEFVQKSSNIKYLESACNFAKSQRALGMGVLGWHSLLQSRMIPFESMESKFLNNFIWRSIKEKADKATKELADRFGEPELLNGYGIRNVTTLAIAPTTSSSFILGQVSPSIEPENSCYYVKKLAKGSFTYKNPYLKDILIKYKKNDDETWNSILIKGGSVQHLDFLNQNEKDVFKTFGEISQSEIVVQAAQRQKYIDQSQSLNLMIHPKNSPKEVSQLLIKGWELGVKGFYYQRSCSPTQELSRNLLECTSCQA